MNFRECQDNSLFTLTRKIPLAYSAPSKMGSCHAYALDIECSQISEKARPR